MSESEHFFNSCFNCNGTDLDRSNPQNSPLPEMNFEKKELYLWVDCENCGESFCEVYAYVRSEKI